MKLEALDHPKTLDLAARLGIELPTVIGHLELLWAFTGKKSPRGDVGKWPVGAIARACYWMGDPQTFMDALVQAGFIDEHPVHKYVVHDWQDHASRWVKAKLKSLGTDFISITEVPVVPTVVPTVVETIGLPSKTRQDKTREEQEAREQARGVLGLDLATWDRWLAYRVGIRKPIKPISIVAAAKELAAYGLSQASVVQHSIANGYQGLIPPKSNGKPAAQPKRDPTPDEIAEARRKAAADNAATAMRLGLSGVLKAMP